MIKDMFNPHLSLLSLLLLSGSTVNAQERVELVTNDGLNTQLQACVTKVHHGIFQFFEKYAEIQKLGKPHYGVTVEKPTQYTSVYDQIQPYTTTIAVRGTEHSPRKKKLIATTLISISISNTVSTPGFREVDVKSFMTIDRSQEPHEGDKPLDDLNVALEVVDARLKATDAFMALQDSHVAAQRKYFADFDSSWEVVEMRAIQAEGIKARDEVHAQAENGHQDFLAFTAHMQAFEKHQHETQHIRAKAALEHEAQALDQDTQSLDAARASLAKLKEDVQSLEQGTHCSILVPVAP